MAANNMHNLTTLIKRLEAATSRLEDIASSTIEPAKSNGVSPTAPVTSPAPLPTPQPPVPSTVKETPKPKADPLPESVEAFDLVINGPVKKFTDLSNALGGPVAKQAARVGELFAAQRRFILVSTKARKPNFTPDNEGLKAIQASVLAIGDIKNANRGSPAFNQLSAVADGTDMLGWWVTVDPKPHKHVEESKNSALYNGNRVAKEFKDKESKEYQWLQAYYQIFKDVAEYAKDTFEQGIPWNAKGVSFEEAWKSSQQSGSPQPSAGGPPPPPPPPGPPPPPSLLLEGVSAPKPAPAASGLDAVFSELNRGEAVTKGLKKVTADQMTHKNPSLRAGATVPTRSDSQSSSSSISRGKSPAPGKKPKPESMRTKKPPIKKLDGNKWFIENYDNESAPITIEASISHSILISRCNKTTIIVKGKANAISIDNSPRLSLIVESLVSSIDVIKSSNFALQVMGTLPTILMDQVDGAQVYLGKASMNTEVFSSKCSGINLNVIDATSEEEDYKEVPLPEQIRTWIGKDGKINSEIVEHAG